MSSASETSIHDLILAVVPITGIQYQNEGAHFMYDISCTVPGNYIANGYPEPDK